ncbi:caspase domain-containing protein [Russula brevipes]|nr:caspase domain-containing protein [Russula brevipes]
MTGDNTPFRPPPFPRAPPPNVPGQSHVGGEDSWDNRQQHPSLDGTTYPGAGHGHPFSPVSVWSLRYNGTGHGAPSQLPHGSRPAFPLPFSGPSSRSNVPYPYLYDTDADGGGLVHEQNQVPPESQFQGYPYTQLSQQSFNEDSRTRSNADLSPTGLPMSPGFFREAGNGTTLPPPTGFPRAVHQPHSLQPNNMPHSYRDITDSGGFHLQNPEPISRAGSQDERPAQVQNTSGPGEPDLTNRISFEPPPSSYPQLPGLHLPFSLTGEIYGLQMPVPEPFSLCTGKRRALIIGVNYTSHPDPYLGYSGAPRTPLPWQTFFALGFKPDDVRIITDKNPLDLPTKENILDAMRELVRDAKPHDSFFLYFSGHGTQVKDMNGDEQDGLDECICAMDWRGNGQPPYEDTPGLIIDDVMHEILVKHLPLQCRLTAVFDACHSGTVLDLPYIYSSKGVVKEIKHQNKLGLLREKANYADVVSLSASKDSRTAKETRKGGALRLAFINCLTTFRYNVTYKELIKSVRDYMRNNRYKQKPVLSSSYEIDTDGRFIV